MSSFGYLFIKEAKQFKANPFMPVVLVLLPLLLMLLVPLAANMEVRDVRLSVVDGDRSTMSVRLIERISQSGYFVFSSYEDSYEAAMDQLSRGNADIILEIPHGMEEKTGNGETVEIFIAANAVNNTKGAMGGGYLSSIITDFSADLAGGPDQAAAPLSVVPQYRYNPHLDYKLFMVPALMIVVIVLVGGFFPTMSIVSEKENGTIEQINVSPVRKRDFILSKVVFYGILGIFAFTLAILIAHFVYGLASHGGLLEIFTSAMIFLVFMGGFGLIISNYSDTMLQAVFLMLFFVLIFMLMSGIFTPVSSMETWSQYVTYILPTRYFVNILRAVCLKGSHFADMTFDFVMLSVFAVVINVLAVVTYRKQN
ncbi:MAG TPA: ABC transporter permease [Candidatus Cryptobacteroides intestinipullorum]|nr:ABC transporter permease [Candidatus Cryptobacteroides intestinipullorum]